MDIVKEIEASLIRECEKLGMVYDHDKKYAEGKNIAPNSLHKHTFHVEMPKTLSSFTDRISFEDWTFLKQEWKMCHWGIYEKEDVYFVNIGLFSEFWPAESVYKCTIRDPWPIFKGAVNFTF